MHSPSSPPARPCRSLQVIGALTARRHRHSADRRLFPGGVQRAHSGWQWAGERARDTVTAALTPSRRRLLGRAPAPRSLPARQTCLSAFSVPAGWEVVANAFVLKSGADPTFGVGLPRRRQSVRRRVPLDPGQASGRTDRGQPGERVPEGARPARRRRAAGDRRRVRRPAAPVHRARLQGRGLQGCHLRPPAGRQCRHQHRPAGEVPNYWAQTPNQQNQVLILDVHGTRLVIVTGHPPDISTQDRADIDTILRSVQIG